MACGGGWSCMGPRRGELNRSVSIRSTRMVLVEQVSPIGRYRECVGQRRSIAQ